MNETVIVALDTDAHTALSLARSIAGRVRYVKVGMTLFYAEGPSIVSLMRDLGFDVFLDLKLHDIPHQVEGAAREIARLGVRMFTVHASGGRAMMEAAVRGACEGSFECGADTPDVLAVTVLTSLSGPALAEIGMERSPASQAVLLGEVAREAGVQGVVCSPQEAAAMRGLLGQEALVVTPGVRPTGAESGDQARVMTPVQAVAAGASHLVIGRPVTAAPDPAAALARILEEL
jgi:orotidine-5'-phosphate decarboxylase